jgi:hypothetical protein
MTGTNGGHDELELASVSMTKYHHPVSRNRLRQHGDHSHCTLWKRGRYSNVNTQLSTKTIGYLLSDFVLCSI